MGFLFSSPKAPSTPVITQTPVTATPTVDEAAQSAEQENKLRARKGRAATILTSEAGAPVSSTASNVLLGR